MWKLLALFCLVATQAWSLEFSTLYGEYKTIYTWPKLEWNLANCNPAFLSKADSTLALDSCHCGRQTANLALVNVEAGSKKLNVLVDYVGTMDELKLAVEDKCSCSGKNIDHDVAWRINDNYIVHYDANTSKIYLLGKTVPSADDLKGMIDGFFWKSREGVQVCQ